MNRIRKCMRRDVDIYLRPFLVHADICRQAINELSGRIPAGDFMKRKILEFVYEHRK
jgi:hypothetical protein